MAPLVSILIPSYNAEKWIKESIESALSQTWKDKEIILVDDGSTDDSLRIARKLATSRVKVIPQVHKGGNAARNTALRFAQGDYIQWLDADDILGPEKIEKQMARAGDGGSSRILLTSSWGEFYRRYRKARFHPDNLWRDLDPVEWLITKFNENVWMNPAVWLVSRRLTELSGPWDERLVKGQDGEYICRVVSNSEAVKFVPEARSYYRQSNLTSVSKVLSGEACESVFLSICLRVGYLRSLEDSARTRVACLACLQGFVGDFCFENHEIFERATSLAKELGGEVLPPVKSWKYSAIEKLAGSRFAKQCQKMNQMFQIIVARNFKELV